MDENDLRALEELSDKFTNISREKVDSLVKECVERLGGKENARALPLGDVLTEVVNYVLKNTVGGSVELTGFKMYKLPSKSNEKVK